MATFISQVSYPAIHKLLLDTIRDSTASSHGHIFVMNGDIRSVYCDAWLVPSKSFGWKQGDKAPEAMGLQSMWLAKVANHLPPDSKDEKSLCQVSHSGGGMYLKTPLIHQIGPDTFAIHGLPEKTPRPLLYNFQIPPGELKEQLKKNLDVKLVVNFLESAFKLLEKEKPLANRQRHLLAIPAVGTGYGGGRAFTGTIINLLFVELLNFTRKRDFDVVLVLNEASTYALAQRIRLETSMQHWWNALRPYSNAEPTLEQFVEKAKELADKAKRGTLVLFVGAGVSVGAGLPMWGELLTKLAAMVGITSVQDLAYFGSLDFLAKAQVIQDKMSVSGKVLGAAIAEALEKPFHSLAHGLLAALPVTQVVTTNYDQLFEMASKATGSYKQLSLLPHAPAPNCDRWILKMHGCISHPESIVLTRQDYLRYGDTNAALAGIVQSMLITSHMLFVGFSLNDENFHRVADGVKKAIKDNQGRSFGTNLNLISNPFVEGLWQPQVPFLNMLPANPSPSGADYAKGGRKLDIFLDLLGCLSSSSYAHLLDPRFTSSLSAEEELLRQCVQQFQISLMPHFEKVKTTTAWPRVEAFFLSLGSVDNPMHTLVPQLPNSSHGSPSSSVGDDSSDSSASSSSRKLKKSK